MIHGHAIVRDSSHSSFNGSKPAILANLRALAGEQVFGRVNQVIRDARFVNLGKRAHNRRGITRLLFPVAAGPIGRLQRFDELHRVRFRKIIDVRLARQTAQVTLLLRISVDRLLKGLIRGNPEILPERVVIAVDAHRTSRPDEQARTKFELSSL